jgi:acetolactate decarboxylase
VAHFRPNHIRGFPRPLDYPALLARIDQVAPERNLFLAVRIDGVFSYVKVRAAPAQQKPYPPLAEVAKTQPVFEYTDVRGTVVGFRCPALVKGLNVPGYHLHFISDDRSGGGHVLDLRLSGGVLTLDRCNRFHMILPEDGRVLEQIDLTRDRSIELERVEK